MYNAWAGRLPGTCGQAAYPNLDVVCNTHLGILRPASDIGAFLTDPAARGKLAGYQLFLCFAIL